MPAPTNDDLLDEFGYSQCVECHSEQLTFSIDPNGRCIYCAARAQS